jgi:hypothetical protein
LSPSDAGWGDDIDAFQFDDLMGPGADMFGPKYLALTVVAALTLLTLPARAQKMYRCGNSFQDLPCAGAQQGKVVGNVGTPTAATSTPAKDTQCTQRGADAMKIVWMRDNGATKERQMAELDAKSISEARRQEEMQLIESVYSKRGSAPAVRATVESECVAEKERFSQAAALAAAAVRLQGGTPVAPTTSSRAPSESDLARMEARQREEIAANEEVFKKSRCADMARQYENLRRQERAGGSVGTMVRLNDLRRSLDDRQRSEGC